jgi:hypothetical protein
LIKVEHPLSRLTHEDRSRPLSSIYSGSKHERLVQGGLGTIGQLLDDAMNGYAVLLALPTMGRQSQLAIQQRLVALSDSIGADGAVDWAGFDRRCGLEMQTDRGDRLELSVADRLRPVTALYLGSRGVRLHVGGLRTLGDLLEDRAEGFAKIYGISGAGRRTVALVSQRLGALEACADELGAVDWHQFDKLWGGEVLAVENRPQAKLLSHAVLARPIEVLRLGTKVRFLHEAGLHCLGDLCADGVATNLHRLRGISQRTAKVISERLSVICLSDAELDGPPDWDAIAEAWGFTLTPTAPVPDSAAFLSALPEVIEALLHEQKENIDRVILSERISQSHDDKLTLQAIGSKFGKTRQRVQQRQVDLLDALSDALINDDQSQITIHFRESFRGFWVRAALYLSGVEELDLRDFERGLETSWNLPAGQLTPFIPLAIAILAADVRMPKAGLELHPALETAPETVLSRPLSDFPFGRARAGLEGAGLTSLGLLLEAAKENRLPAGSVGRIALGILDGVGKALAVGTEDDVDAWATGLGLTALPSIEPQSGAAFFDCLDSALGTAAEVNATARRAGSIYRMRTCIPRRRRPTLSDIATQLSCHGPAIKKEETQLLARLHAQLLEGDLTDAKVIWRHGFLQFFAQAAKVHKSSGDDYDRFCNSLAQAFGLKLEDISERAEGLWAVLCLYPGGRRVRAHRNREAPTETVRLPAPAVQAPIGGVVVLRGFRRLH